MSKFHFRQGRHHAHNIYMHGPGVPEEGIVIAHACDASHARTMVACLNAAWPRPGMDLVTLASGQVLQVHHPSKCAGGHCAIHNPSQHHMVSWPQIWRGDIRLMERFCVVHECGHPDPDDLEYKKQTMSSGAYARRAFETHGCCGCCTPPSSGLHNETTTEA